jgi:hypothetical protein
MFQRFRIAVAKVDRDDTHIAMVIHVCFNCMFQMFHLNQTYVASILIYMLQKQIWMLHIHPCCKHTFQEVLGVSYVYCKCFIRMLHMFAMVFKCF